MFFLQVKILKCGVHHLCMSIFTWTLSKNVEEDALVRSEQNTTSTKVQKDPQKTKTAIKLRFPIITSITN